MSPAFFEKGVQLGPERRGAAYTVEIRFKGWKEISGGKGLSS